MNNKTFLELSVWMTEFLVDIVKVLVTVTGVLAASVADVVMGAIGISLLFGGFGSTFFGYSSVQIGGAISLAAGAFQIYMWAVLKRRNIGFVQALKFWELPKDMRSFVGVALSVMIIDTAIDVSPVPILVANSAYKAIPELHLAMVVLVSILVIIICGFSEILTSNIKEILIDKEDRKPEKHGVSHTSDNFRPQNPKYQPKHKPVLGPVFRAEMPQDGRKPIYHPVGMGENNGKHKKQRFE